MDFPLFGCPWGTSLPVPLCVLADRERYWLGGLGVVALFLEMYWIMSTLADTTSDLIPDNKSRRTSDLLYASPGFSVASILSPTNPRKQGLLSALF